MCVGLARMMVMENGLKQHQGTGMKAVMPKLKEQKPVQESLRSKALSHLLNLLGKITSTCEPEGVRLLIATVLLNE